MTKEELDALRYDVTLENGVKTKDAFISAIMEMLFLKNDMNGLFGKRRVKKTMTRLAPRLLLDRCAEVPEEERQVFIDEYRDLGRLFIKLSRNDKVYSTGFLNLVTLNEKQFQAKIWEDFTLMGATLPEMAELGELYAPFRKGLEQAFAAYREKVDRREAEDEL